MIELSLAALLYPEFAKECSENEWVYGPGSYQPIIDHHGKVAVQVEDEDYQGDTRVLYDNDGKIGLLQFGWGSCSGCDALQACDNLKQLEELIQTFQPTWFESKEDALKYFNEHDWEGDYSWHQEEQKDFIEKCKQYLTAVVAS